MYYNFKVIDYVSDNGEINTTVNKTMKPMLK